MKIVSLKRLGDIENELVAKYPDISFSFYDKANSILDNEKKELDVLIGYDGNIDERFIRSCPNLKWIAWFATGVNNLPLECIKKKGITLTNTRGIQSKQLSEYILTFILDDHKKMKTSFINQQKHIYDSTLTGKRLKDETILFLGTGAIAQDTVKLLTPFNLKIIGVSKTGKYKEGFNQTYEMNELDKLLGEADIIVNTLPETEETYHLLNKHHFHLMKKNTLFINVGRGTIIEEQNLIELLREKLIRHAYLDVFENEPLGSEHPLYDLDNVTITAHITGNDKENKKEATEMFERNLNHFLNKEEISENVVNLKDGY